MARFSFEIRIGTTEHSLFLLDVIANRTIHIVVLNGKIKIPHAQLCDEGRSYELEHVKDCTYIHQY